MLLEKAFLTKKNNRGRRPIKDKEYIEQSLETLQMYEDQIEAAKRVSTNSRKKKMSDKELKDLYCKYSALKTRVKKRQEQVWQKQSVDSFNKKFKNLCEIITD